MTPREDRAPARIASGLLAVRQGTWRAACSAAAVLLAAVAVIVACLVLVGVGVYLMPPVLAGLRALANAARRRIGVAEIPQPAGPASGWSAGLTACRRAFRAPATRRDLIWAAGDWPVGVTLGLLPALLLAGGLWGLSAPLTWRWATEAWDGSWFLFVPLISDVTAALAAVVGVALLAAGLIFAPWLGRLSDAWAARLLGPSTVTRLTERVEHLATTRADTLDAQQSEIRRIERDLHDGAQARLMAMGMTLKMMERSLERDPEAARTLLGQAQEDSRKAMQELRDLVHGIHPPILADRGLVDAVRALALECQVPTQVESTLTGRLEPPIESALYFTVAELLTNVVKHAAATAVQVTLATTPAGIRVTVADSGRGGADLSRGTGIAGVRRRLAAFDGTLTVDSPTGGPTRIDIFLPMAAS
ncbi:sensor histidine kinase [Micromonospora sp. DT231]|uniref:sensor histidine kinase n=1 Tax=Micromonospora sp. DT231 TaxID=3416526 RepID=UPI003CF9A896